MQLHLFLGSKRRDKGGGGREPSPSVSGRLQCRLSKASLDHTVRPSQNKKEREDSIRRFTALAEILDGSAF